MGKRLAVRAATEGERLGLAGLEDAPRGGRPPTYTREQVGEIVATALTGPQTLDLPFQSWTVLSPTSACRKGLR